MPLKQVLLLEKLERSQLLLLKTPHSLPKLKLKPPQLQLKKPPQLQLKKLPQLQLKKHPLSEINNKYRILSKALIINIES